MVTVPPSVTFGGPPVRVAVTLVASGAGFPPASVICTAGCCARVLPLATVAEGWVVMLTSAGAPAVRVTPVEVADASPGALNPRV